MRTNVDPVAALAVPTRVSVRIANLSDAPLIAALHAASWRFAYRGMLSDDYLDGDLLSERHNLWIERLNTPAPKQLVLLAEIDDELAGFACAFGAEDPQLGALLDNLHVSPKFHRHGIGTRLMADIVTWCRQEFPGAGLHLWVLPDNTRARRFYEQLGGQKVREEIWHSPDGGDLPSLCYAWKDLATFSPTLSSRIDVDAANIRDPRPRAI